MEHTTLLKKIKTPRMRGLGKALLLPVGMFVLMEIISFVVFHESLFASSLDWNNFIRNVAISMIASYALSLNMASGRMDLSLGGQQLIGCVIGGNIAMSLGLGPCGVLVLSVLFGMLAGLVVGLLFITLRIEAFVLGLGVALVFEALAASYSMDGLRLFGQNMSLLANPLFSIALAAAVCALMILLMNHSEVGLHYDAIRGSQRIAIESGINITANALLCYVLCGGLIALAGCLSAGKSGEMGTSLNLASAATAFVGFVPVFLCFVLQRWCPMMTGIPISVVTFQLLSMGLTKMELSSAASSTITMLILLLFMVAISFIGSLEQKKAIQKRSMET